MINPFRKWFGRDPKTPVYRQEPIAVAPPAPAPDPFDWVWDMLMAEQAPAPLPLAAEEREQVEALAPKVLAHFAQNRPEPASFPALAMRIIRIIGEPDLDMNQLIQAISPDPAISLHVLRAANSALNSRGNEIQDLRRAVLHIGTREVGEIALGVASRSLFDLSLKAEFEFYQERWHNLYLDTMAVAFGASQFAFENQLGRADHAFLAGMFHDVGKSLALRSVAALVMDGEVDSPVPDRVLDALLERVHIEIGCDLHRLWGLPDYLTEICARHHDPEVPAGHEHMDLHTLRLVEGFHRLALDPSNLERLDETRQSIRATGMVRRGIQRLYIDMEMQSERVRQMFPA